MPFPTDCPKIKGSEERLPNRQQKHRDHDGLWTGECPLFLLLALLVGCSGAGLPPHTVVPLGTPSNGWLGGGGVALPESGEGFVRARPGDDTRFGTAALVALLERAASQVERTFPGTPAIHIGDLSRGFGGRHERHHSHRSGRDADVIYYATDALARPITGGGFLAYDRYGIARDARPGEDDALAFLDEARTWAFFRVLLAEDATPVEWIFCSTGVKSRLLAYALAHEPSPDVLVRAAYVLHQPTDGRPHDDHFHVRLACLPSERERGCREGGPIWPWLRRDAFPPDAAVRLDDDALLHALLDDPPSE